MTIERTHSGAWRVSAIVAGYRISRLFIGYTRRAAVREFKAEIRQAVA